RREEIEILSFEATLTSSVAEKAAQMVGIAYRLRIMGSLALSLCHLAAGRVDAVCSLKAARSVDIAAAQLLVRERGIAIDLPEAPPFGAAPLDIKGRSRVVAAATPEVAAELFAPRIRPLAQSPKLGPVLWQLPPTFRRDDERLAGALELLPPGRHCFEFRHESWFVDDVYERLRRHGVALVIGDAPERPFQ